MFDFFKIEVKEYWRTSDQAPIGHHKFDVTLRQSREYSEDDIITSIPIIKGKLKSRI